MSAIAIDGPAGAGKSTIAKIVARDLSFVYVDTGAMYRALALFFLRKGISADREEELAFACREAEVHLENRDGAPAVFLNGENVSSLIRTEEVSSMASRSSSRPCVREKLLDLQRELAQRENVVMDGRDIGTVVLPDADLKIYLTADVEIRARRRLRELEERGETHLLSEIERDIRERDERDKSRPLAPLKRAEDAHEIDSSYRNIEEVSEQIIGLWRERGH